MTATPALIPQDIAYGPRDFERIASLLYDRTGIVLRAGKESLVFSRLARRIRELNLPSFQAYCERLHGPDADAELGVMIDRLTTNTTKFFREAHHFDQLARDVLEPLKRAGKRRLRIWSAACSLGHEPYTIAAVAAATIPDIAQWDAKILATDIDTSALQKGREGVYPAAETKDCPPHYAARMFQPCDRADELRIAAPLRELVTFKRLNLHDLWPMGGPFDAIFCRNVVIYFDVEAQKKLFDRMAGLLAPQGRLFIGHSETLNGVCAKFRPVGRTAYALASGGAP